ncbi:MAG: hypothetical protein AAGH46_09620 [Bacteroidota bacterium]
MIANPKCLALIFVLTTTLGWAQTKEEALRDAKITAQAAVENDLDLVLNHTLPTVVEMMGGIENAKNMIAQTFQSMEKQGFKILKSDIVSVSDIVQEQNQYRCYVENHIEMVTNDQGIFSKSYLLGVYNEDGNYWWFVEAKQLQTPSMAELIIPGYKTQLEIPQDEVKPKSKGD